MSHTQAKVNIEGMLERSYERYENVYLGNRFNYNYEDYGVELFFATCVRGVFCEIKKYNLYKFWEGISYESRVEFFVNIFKKNLFEFFEYFDKDDAGRFLRSIYRYHRFRKLLHYTFCRMEEEVMGKEAENEFINLYNDVHQQLSDILNGQESY